MHCGKCVWRRRVGIEKSRPSLSFIHISAVELVCYPQYDPTPTRHRVNGTSDTPTNAPVNATNGQGNAVITVIVILSDVQQANMSRNIPELMNTVDAAISSPVRTSARSTFARTLERLTGRGGLSRLRLRRGKRLSRVGVDLALSAQQQLEFGVRQPCGSRRRSQLLQR